MLRKVAQGTSRLQAWVFGKARYVDCTSNHLLLCSLTENTVKRKGYAATGALDNESINCLPGLKRMSYRTFYYKINLKGKQPREMHSI